MALLFGVLVLSTAAVFAAVLLRGRREWCRSDTLSSETGWLITAAWLLAGALLATALVWRPLGADDVPLLLQLLGGLLIVIGVVVAAPGYLPFASVRHLYGQDRGRLITGGIYSYTRNPQYTGIGAALGGAAVIGASPVALGVALAYWVGITLWVRIEEQHLRTAFGRAYERYASDTPRFFGMRGSDASR